MLVMDGQPPIATETLAELYLRQGHVEQGVAIYRRLVAADPGNRRLRQRLAALAGEGGGMFREHLERISSNVVGVLSCAVMGTDGIPIDTLTAANLPSDFDAQNVLVEYAGQLGQLQRSSESLGSGPVQEYFIQTDAVLVLMRPITAEYFLGVTLSPGGNIGKGRYLMRVIAPKLVAELS